MQRKNLSRLIVLFAIYCFGVVFISRNKTGWPELYSNVDYNYAYFDGRFKLESLLYGNDTERHNEFKSGTLKVDKMSQNEKKEFDLVMKKRRKFIRDKCNEFSFKSQNYYENEAFLPYVNKIYCPNDISISDVWYQNFMILWVHKNVSNNLICKRSY